VPDSLINTELDLDFFRKNFPTEFVQQHVKKLTFCGDDGDPIYAHDLIPVIAYFKQIKSDIEIVIVTNGSYKSQQWWQDLATQLGPNDSVHFSIDGWDQASNSEYRVNSDYASIMTGVRTLREHSTCQMIWDAIAFRFNQKYIQKMKTQSKELGFDRFQLTLSTKFGSVYPSYGAKDILEPLPVYISSSHRFQREISNFTGKSTPVWPINIQRFERVQTVNNITPLCSIGNKGLYISARGHLFPCCWVANRYQHNNEWQQLGTQFNLHERTLQDALADEFWQEQFQSYRWKECEFKCSASQVTRDYATEW
jgi:MoaA/NifB/PqqE/SkfB family radical SAM enzyme